MEGAQKQNLLIIGGVLAAGIVLYLVLQGSSSSSSGVSWGQANPASVQALYSAQAATTASQNQLQMSRNSNLSGIASQIIGLAATQNNNATALGINAQNTGASVASTRINSDTTLGVNKQNTDASLGIANTNAGAAMYSAAQAAMAQIAGSDAAERTSTNQAYYSTVSKTNEAYYNTTLGMTQAREKTTQVLDTNRISNANTAVNASAATAQTIYNTRAAVEMNKQNTDAQVRMNDSTNATAHANAQTASKSAGFAGVLSKIPVLGGLFK
ncbi:MAG: hypothetical protein EBW68_08435 [Actinobacteria bacterium]|nr:hypothetical protein [Actinomycetota bacterium]